MENITHIRVGDSRMWQAGLEWQVLLWRGVIYFLYNILGLLSFLILNSGLKGDRLIAWRNANFLTKNLSSRLIKLFCLVSISYANDSEYFIACYLTPAVWETYRQSIGRNMQSLFSMPHKTKIQFHCRTLGCKILSLAFSAMCHQEFWTNFILQNTALFGLRGSQT